QICRACPSPPAPPSPPPGRPDGYRVRTQRQAPRNTARPSGNEVARGHGRRHTVTTQCVRRAPRRKLDVATLEEREGGLVRAGTSRARLIRLARHQPSVKG